MIKLFVKVDISVPIVTSCSILHTRHLRANGLIAIREIEPTWVLVYTCCSYRPHVLRNDVAGTDDDGAECVEARISVGGPSESRCSPPGGLHVSGTRLDCPRPSILGSFQVPDDGTPPTPRNCWNYYFIAATSTRVGRSISFDSLESTRHFQGNLLTAWNYKTESIRYYIC